MYSTFIKILLGLVLVFTIVIVYPVGESIEYFYSVGSIWTGDDLYAQFSFPIYKDFHKYEEEKRQAVNSVYPVFDYVEHVNRSIFSESDSIFRVIFAKVGKSRLISLEDSIPFLSSKDLEMLDKWMKEDEKNYTKLMQDFQKNVTIICRDILKTGIVDDGKYLISHPYLAIRKNRMEEITPIKSVYTYETALVEFEERFNSLIKDEKLVLLAKKFARWLLKPNLKYNSELTSIAINSAKENVPRTIGFVQAGELIVSKYDRITEEIKLKLDSYLKSKIDRSPSHNMFTHRVGIFAQVALLVGLYAFYLNVFRKKIFQNNIMLLLIVLLFLIVVFFSYVSMQFKVQLPLQYLILVPTASMLLAIIFDSRVAFYGTVVLAFIVGGIRGNDYSVTLASLVAGLFSVYSVRDIINRTQIFRSIVFIFIGYSIVILALVLERFEDFNTLSIKLSFALANAVFSSVIAYGLLILFEHIFKVTTDLKLVELSQISHPLLELLSEKAPGTFHHSMILGDLAEAGADAIGAKTILARVGAYYHDIGKIEKPEYFVENQIGNINRHTRLRPRMSALILISHVKDGIELGKKYHLPEVILDFIPQHHGTTRISYFYDKALKQAASRKNPKDNIREEDFCYPGPKPQTKEAAIVMLADSVEAATRAITEMTPQKLESVIDNMFRQRFLEGQLDECELTLRDLSKIREAFLKNLIGIHHQRIKYPEPKLENEPQLIEGIKTQSEIEDFSEKNSKVDIKKEEFDSNIKEEKEDIEKNVD